MGLNALALTLMLLHERKGVFAGLDSPAASLWDRSALAHGALRSLGETAGFLLPKAAAGGLLNPFSPSG